MSREVFIWCRLVAALILKYRGFQPIRSKHQFENYQSFLRGNSGFPKLRYFRFEDHFSGNKLSWIVFQFCCEKSPKLEQIHFVDYNSNQETIRHVAKSIGSLLSRPNLSTLFIKSNVNLYETEADDDLFLELFSCSNRKPKLENLSLLIPDLNLSVIGQFINGNLNLKKLCLDERLWTLNKKETFETNFLEILTCDHGIEEIQIVKHGWLKPWSTLDERWIDRTIFQNEFPELVSYLVNKSHQNWISNISSSDVPKEKTPIPFFSATTFNSVENKVIFVYFNGHQSDKVHIKLKWQWFYLFRLNLQPFNQIPIVSLAIFQDEKCNFFILSVQTVLAWSTKIPTLYNFQKLGDPWLVLSSSIIDQAMAWQMVRLVLAESLSANRLNSGFSIDTKKRIIKEVPLWLSFDCIRLKDMHMYSIWLMLYDRCSMTRMPWLIIPSNKIITSIAVAKYSPTVVFQNQIQILNIVTPIKHFKIQKSYQQWPGLQKEGNSSIEWLRLYHHIWV